MRTPTRPKLAVRRASALLTVPLEASIDAGVTNTGRPASLERAMRCRPLKFASTVPGWFRSYDPSPFTRTIQGPTSASQESDARQLRGTSYDGSMSATLGDRSASTPPPPTHSVGAEVGFAMRSVQSGTGTAEPTHESDRVLVPSPVRARASATRSGRNKSRNSPMPPRITPIGFR